MITVVLDEYIRPVLVRYVDHYGWSFNVAMRIINRYHGTQYTQKQLRTLYQQSQ